ncbi:MAG: VOC family protein [Pseudomonadota bacterium]
MTDLRAIDHVVVATRDLDAAAAGWEAAGFTLTPRAVHPEEMGTANRLIQFADRSFIELIEVDRPTTLRGHDPAQRFFGFGAHNQTFLAQGEGMSMLVFTGQDSHADAEAFTLAGLDASVPFDFGRTAILPDGRAVEVAFSLAFATTPALPREAFFTCHNRFPENFWKPAFQTHANGAEGIAAVEIATGDPSGLCPQLEALTGGVVETGGTPQKLPLANEQWLEVGGATASATGFTALRLKRGAGEAPPPFTLNGLRLV